MTYLVKSILFLWIIALPGMGYAQKDSLPGHFSISAQMSGLKNGDSALLIDANTKEVLARTVIQNDQFQLTGKVDEPVLTELKIGSLPDRNLYIENSPIQLTGDASDPSKMMVTGSKSQLDFEDFQKIFNPLVSKLNVRVKTLNQLMEGATSDALSLANQNYQDAKGEVENAIDQFVLDKPASYVTPWVLFVTIKVDDNPIIMRQRFNKLAPQIQTSLIGKDLDSYIQYYEVGYIGTSAPDFTQNDINGQPVSLSSFLGKYVLIDFWASWCGPCRRENPNVVKAYNEFKNKNFTIFSVSLDRNKQSWINAIENDHLTWTHVSDLNYWDNAVARQYHITSIPQNFLIDPKGIIIAKNLSGEQLSIELEKILK
ncbi:MAG: AhpC/TSA family protein [Bacteroidetes bacterium]|nr:AhpC/TSA family protein [Bacteroidota bacterium]